MKQIIFLLIICHATLTAHAATPGQSTNDAPDVLAARKARDHAAVEELQRTVDKAQAEAAKTKSFEAYLRLALFEVWLCEAAEDKGDDKLFKRAAEAGVAAAEQAVALNPKSSDAHQLLGDLLSQLIPQVFGGGMRYGKRATDEMDKAIELNPKNVNAYVSRAISYYYTPDSFGGSKSKAFELLKKAVEIDASQDSPHIWLAFFALDAGKTGEAASEINLALKANPERAFTNYVESQVTAARKSATQKKQTPKQ
jgi:cytochrome c-type biogenesis protein CcmH/NrfG